MAGSAPGGHPSIACAHPWEVVCTRCPRSPRRGELDVKSGTRSPAHLDVGPVRSPPFRPARPSLGILFARPMVQDSLAAAGLSAVALAGTLTHLHVEIPASIDEVIRRRLDGWGIVLILLQTMTIAWRRKAPVTILAVTGGAFLAYSFRGYAPSLATFGFMAALYTVAAHRDRPISIPAGVAAVAALATLQARGRPAEASEAIIAETFILGAAWFLGDAMRIRRGQVVQLEDRASRLEREREER